MADPATTTRTPRIYQASAPGGVNGSVVRGTTEITVEEAILIRQAGGDVVVCGDELDANRGLAVRIEAAAVGNYKLELPHRNAGPGSLPHCQPAVRPPEGHTFYETSRKKAKKARS